MERKTTSWRIAAYAGSGMAIGAALGLLFGLLLFEDASAGVFTGAAVGMVIGLIRDVLSDWAR